MGTRGESGFLGGGGEEAQREDILKNNPPKISKIGEIGKNQKFFPINFYSKWCILAYRLRDCDKK